jgi:hypothetical protein
VKIPEGEKRGDKLKRLNFVEDIKERCLVSRTERREQYTSYRYYWLYGSDGSYENEDLETGLAPPPGNKLWPHIDQLSSFLYAQETTRFSVEIGATASKEFQDWSDPLDGYVNDEWHSSNTDITFGLALNLALVYGCTHIKPLWKRNGIYPGIVLPHNFGVLREDSFGLHKQEAFVHCYTITPSQFTNDFGELPRFSSLIKQVSKRGGTMLDGLESGIDRIIMSGQDPLGGGGGQAQVDWLTQVSMNYVPRVREELIELCEVYIYDDELKDFRIFTMADPCIPLLDRPLHKTGWLKNEVPFNQVCPNPDPNYYFGISEVERLTPLQTYRNRCMAQIDHLQELQAHPPSTSTGFPSDLLELQYTLDTPNGFMNNPDPAGMTPKADRVKIELPTDLYARIDRIDQMFDDMSGLPPSTQGKSVPGVRSGGHASELAKLGSSRAKKRALIVEDSLEQLATIYLKLLMKYDDKRLAAKNGEKFVADQFTDDFTVKVDAHSNSPIFADDQTALAFQLLKVKAITRKRFLSMLSVPNRRRLIYELESEIEPAEQKAAEAQQKLEAQRAQSKGPGRPAKANGAHPS